jgi:eukaryotic-like serine/threonine-protein kinase
MARRKSTVEAGGEQFRGGYPLREDALTEPGFAPPETARLSRAEIESAGLVDFPPPRRRRTTPWPLLLMALLLLAGLGAAYAVSHGSKNNAHHPVASPTPRTSTPSSPARNVQPTTVPATTTPTAPATTAAATTAPSLTPPPQQASVPRVVGYQIAKATSILRRAGLTPVMRQLASPAPNGQVIGQNPMAGTKEAKSGRVVLNVSLQPAVSVPNVIGMQGITAVHTLMADHLVASLAYVPSAQPARTVVAQYPLAGTKAKRATRIQINISTGGPRPSGPTGASAG